MAQDADVKARMVKALQLARECLSEAHLTTGLGMAVTGRSTVEAHPDALPIAILAAELYKHVEL